LILIGTLGVAIKNMPGSVERFVVRRGVLFSNIHYSY
jgi:hypothetical protein